MEFVYHLNPRLPKLAWIAAANWAAKVARVTHGPQLETRNDWFFEGAWGGDFGEGRPDTTEIAFGSGAVRGSDTLCFVPSLATTDYLYYRQGAGRLTIGNSLALLLAELGTELDPRFERYAEVNNTILQGISAYERDIPVLDGYVRRLMHNNLVAGPDGIKEVPKPQSPEFTTYSDYKRYLTESYALLATNAKDSRRRTVLKIYSTQSRGYDSTAINSVAAPFNLDGVFTVTTGKGGLDGPDVDDDGSTIARKLGIGTVMPIARREFETAFDDEVYYHAGIHECQDANLKGITTRIDPPALLLTGTLGELWYTNAAGYQERPHTLNGDLARWDLGTHGLTEVRLRAGYIQAAIPYIGARRRIDLLRITESDEMKPWRLGTMYDRPIPRRLGEEAGIPRAEFGQVKIGSVVEWSPPQTPQNESLRQEYYQYLRSNRLRNLMQILFFPTVQRMNWTLWSARETNHRIVYYTLRAFSKLTRRGGEPPVIWSRLRGSLFCFAVNKCASEYVAILRS